MAIDTGPRCRYCSEDADAIFEGWSFGPPDEGEVGKPDMAIPACRVHQGTARLRITSAGFSFQTELEVGTWVAGGSGLAMERRRRL